MKFGMGRLAAFLLVIATSLSGTVACSSKPVDENDPTSLMEDAEAEIKSDHYQLAIDKLRALRNRFPYSSVAADAQLRIADVYFLQESYAEAAGSYETFRDLHPKHPKAPYAMFRTAKAYFKDSPDVVHRDLTPARRALDAYQRFLARYPKVEEAKEAQADVQSIRTLLAEKELSIGNFYLKRDYPDSARPRYERVVELYPETEAAGAAKEKLAAIGAKGKRTDAK